MACHLDGGSCPHDFGFERGGGYLTSGSSSYAGGSLYASAGQYNGQTKTGFNYTRAGKSGAEYLSAMTPLGLASYAANPKYDAVYKGVGKYVGQTKSANTASEEKGVEENSLLAEQQRDTARPAAMRNTIDDTVDAQNAIAVQRNFLEQMIQSAKQQAIAPQQMQYRVLYS